jgi:photosystem II stability/assembly factor-like uncharacterized protein
MTQIPSQSKSAPHGRRAPWYRYSRFWFSLAISSIVISTALMLFAAPRDPYETARLGDPDSWLRSIEPGRAGEMDTLEADLNGVAVSTDGKTVWVAGNAGLIAISTNGGKSWQKETISGAPTPQPAASIDTTVTVANSSVTLPKKH